MDFDVLIVGAGPAGTAAAHRLRREGLSVMLLDRRNAPAEKPCAGGLTLKTLNLMPYSVAPVIERVVSGLTIGVAAEGADRVVHIGHDDPICAFAVRGRFDRLNLDQATAAGVDFARIAEVSAIAEEADAVTTTVDGRPIRARYLIGADGANSTVRRLTSDASWFRRGFALEGIVPHAAIRAEPPMELLFGEVRDGYGWLFPKGDHVNVGVYTHNADVRLSKAGLVAYAARRLGTDRVEAIKGFPLGFGGAGHRQRHARIALVGDAAGFAEPLLGEGIHNAVKSGQAAAEAVVDVERRHGATSFAEALRRRLRPVGNDLARCDLIARRIFYPHLRLMEAGLMHRRSVHTAFLRGFAAGRTMRQITGRFLLPPPYMPATPPSLRDLGEGRRAA